jgi:hypothetical protein
MNDHVATDTDSLREVIEPFADGPLAKSWRRTWSCARVAETVIAARDIDHCHLDRTINSVPVVTIAALPEGGLIQRRNVYVDMARPATLPPR